MRWTIKEAVELLERAFPSITVIIADGDNNYLVGTVEDADDMIHASFLLSVDTSSKLVTEIQIGEGDKFCGVAEQTSLNEFSRHRGPIEINRQDESGLAWCMVGDNEICVHSDTITLRSSLSDGNCNG